MLYFAGHMFLWHKSPVYWDFLLSSATFSLQAIISSFLACIYPNFLIKALKDRLTNQYLSWGISIFKKIQSILPCSYLNNLKVFISIIHLGHQDWLEVSEEDPWSWSTSPMLRILSIVSLDTSGGVHGIPVVTHCHFVWFLESLKKIRFLNHSSNSLPSSNHHPQFWIYSDCHDLVIRLSHYSYSLIQVLHQQLLQLKIMASPSKKTSYPFFICQMEPSYDLIDIYLCLVFD